MIKQWHLEKLLAGFGVALLVIGLITYAPWLVNWFGKLPGDIRIEDEIKMGVYPAHLHVYSQYYFNYHHKPVFS